jgi:stage II sporulation SpoAA-like protein
VISYTIDTEQGLLSIVAEGTPTTDEITRAMQKWWSDPLFRPGLLTLVDSTHVTGLPTLAELEHIVGLIRQHANEIGRKKIAIITGRPVAFGVARQFSALAPGGLTVQVFKDREAAVAWLAQGPA